VQVDVSQFQKKGIPILLCLHGGGFHIGDAMDPALPELMLAVAKLTNQPFLCAFSTYRLVPEHCFPAAIEDILAVVLDLLDRFSYVHIVGISAGANLAAVATMEMHRRCPGRIRSATLLCPLLNPAANSLSYHINRNVWLVPPEWWRWCWRMYLGLPTPTRNTV
jgi:acetyl esterase